MQTIKNHKILAFFNILAPFLIIFGYSTDFLVPSSGTSISGAIAAWGELLLVIVIIADGVVALWRQPTNVSGVPSNGAIQHKSRLSGLSIITGGLLGLTVAYLILAPQGGDAGLLLLPFGAFLTLVGALLGLLSAKVLQRLQN